MERPIFIACESCKNNFLEIYRWIHIIFGVLKIVSCEEVEIYSGKFYGKNTIWWLQKDHYVFKYINFEQVLYDLLADEGNIVIVADKEKPENLPEKVIYIKRELNSIDIDALNEIIEKAKKLENFKDYVY